MRFRVILVGLSLVLVLAPCTVRTPRPAPEDAVRTLSFVPSGLAGGGFVNVVAVDPTDPAVLLAGGDLSGFHRSTDGGATWRTSNTGLTSPEQLSVAAIAFSPATPGLVYGAVGVRGRGGGLVASTDGGVTWSLRSATPRFSGTNNHGIPGIPPVHPRSTGDLLVVDRAGVVYAATLDQGVLRSTDGGTTWTALGLAGRYLRGLASDPATPDVLFAAAYGGGVVRTDDARGAGGFSPLPGSPPNPEELAIAGSTLYVAAGSAGVWSSPVAGGGWTQLGVGRIPDGPTWLSVAAYRACGRDVVYVGATAGAANGVVRSDDGGATWEDLTGAPTTIARTMGGPTGRTWWLGAHASLMPGGRSYVAAHIATAGAPGAMDCLAPDVFVAGRSGVWGSADAGRRWYPLVVGLGVTIARDVATDPRSPDRAFVATADWVVHQSVDDLATVRQRPPPGGTTAPAVAVDGSTGRVYVGTGNPSGNTQGEVFSSPDPLTTGWTDEGLSSTAAAGRRPLAMAVRTVGGQPILIVAVEGAGVWRKVGAAWTQVAPTAMGTIQPTRGASIAWAAGSSSVFLFDRQTGVWRSNDDGRTWMKIWTVSSPFVGTGHVVADPTVAGRLFVAVGGVGVFRVDGATAGSVDAGTLTPVEVGAFVAPGPLVHDGTAVFATETAAPGVTPALLRSGDGGLTWDVVSDADYAAAALYPSAIAAVPGGSIAVATNGNGVLVGRPA
ncbi:MAG TPA: hypothetical protein VE032_00475 [Actinomycetota bacterium]|nr:hypothetical protein [Actinomycetota bacterium]